MFTAPKKSHYDVIVAGARAAGAATAMLLLRFRHVSRRSIRPV